MSSTGAPYHAHIYYSPQEREKAALLRDGFTQNAEILFVGSLTDRPIGPHPIAQFEVHFREDSVTHVIEAIEGLGLRALVHPLTDDDLADHTSHALWIGPPLELDETVLDPPGTNRGLERFGKSDF